MDIRRRKQADPNKLAAKMMMPCSRIMVIAQAYRQLINLLDGDMAAAKDNPFYWEHIAGSGWHGVSNQNTSSLATLIRQANDSYGLKATGGNWGAIFISARALSSLMINGTPKPVKFADSYHCEHTVPVKQRTKELIDWILMNQIMDPAEVAKWILRNTVVATVLKDEENNSGGHKNHSHRPFWRYASMNTSVLCAHPTRGMIPATDMTMADITYIQTVEDPLINGMLHGLDNLSTIAKDSHIAKAQHFLYHKTKAYHSIPSDLSMFVKQGPWTKQDLHVLEARHYNHKPTKPKYTG
jgi:hypothetical protein